MATRLDAHVAQLCSVSKSAAQRLVRAGAVQLNGRAVTKCAQKVKPQDKVEVDESALEAREAALEARDAALAAPEPDDQDFAVVNKPADVTVHPAAAGGEAAASGTLVNGLLARFGAAGLSSGNGDATRPGIVHRLDRPTSGLMVVARTDAAHAALARQFAERRVAKRYAAIVLGKPGGGERCAAPPDAADATRQSAADATRQSDAAGATRQSESGSSWRRIDRPIGRAGDGSTRMTSFGADDAAAAEARGAKPALTEYCVRRVWRARSGALFSLLDVRLLTGRTHQIRAHLSALASPLVGDALYSRQANKSGALPAAARSSLMLAAVALAFDDPASGERRAFRAELPPHMRALVGHLADTCTELGADGAPLAGAAHGRDERANDDDISL